MKINLKGHKHLKDFNNIERDNNYKTELIFSVFIKVLSVIINLLLVPLYLSFFGQELYGVWATIISISGWILLMDVGIGHGVRNELAKALSKGEIYEAKGIVSTGYGVIFLISFVMLIVLLGLWWLFDVDYVSLFNINIDTNINISISLVILFSVTIVGFGLSLVNQILNAHQKNSLTKLNLIIANLLIVIFLFFWNFFGDEGTLLTGSILYGVSNIFGLLLMTYIVFQYYPDLLPRLRLVRKEYIIKITKLGLGFFLLQISVVIIFSTDNLIIAYLFGAEQVTPYVITQKLFQTYFGLSGLLMSPLWSAITNAYVKNELSWVRKKVSFLFKVFAVYIIGLIIIIVLFPFLKDLWVGCEIIVSRNLVLLMAIFALLLFWNNIFATVLNGMGKIRVQVYVSVLGAIINIPLSFYFSKTLSMGTSGVILATIVSLIIGAIFCSYQTRLILLSKATGIWSK